MRRIECNRCRRIKPETSFNFDATTPNGRQRKCRDCQKAINEKYRRHCGHEPRFSPEGGVRRIHLSLPIDWVLAIDDHCERLQLNRSEWFRSIIEPHLKKIIEEG